MLNPEIEKLRKSINESLKIMSNIDLRNRVFLLMINEAARCLEENVVMGIGFPPFKGGLLRYADELGIDYIIQELNRLKELYGDRFTPSQRLTDMQSTQKTFYI